ncbi:two-component sensor histidine kinase [Reticulibacter mediterranei]|uniref:histidine kinase n=1 Tax=Reticulibacter mediterranei TaxID=2778369 RepID=A0A8J3IEH5_9CHLR|nr:ATP-binding protein [Reticulibacter mediterranei]GHO92846.1 two-component sensor histidine kinase [Reticulibacter mediterranei]
MKFTLSQLHRPSLRMQLTIWYTLVFAVLISCSGFLLYVHLQNTLISTLDTALRIRSHQVADDISYEHGIIIFHNNTDELPGFDKDDHDDPMQPGNDADVNTDTLARVLDAQGHTVGVTPMFEDLIVPQESIDLPLHGTPWEGNVRGANGENVRIYSRVLMEDGRVIAIIQVGASLTQFKVALASLLTDFLILAPITLCLSAIGSYILASRTFRPIDRLIRTAKRIKEGDLHHRVPLPETHDEVHRLALTLNEMLEELDQAFMRQQRFVADASHELRTPVAAIRSLTDVALLKSLTNEKQIAEKYISTLSNINTEAQRLGSLISDLLLLARVDEGETALQQEAVHLDMLINAVLINAQPLAMERNITIKKQITTSVIVPGNEGRLIQMMMNLVDNAIKYTHPGGYVTLQLTEEAHEACLRVIDTGIGIPAEHLPHIFERFYRVDPAHSSQGGSSGLGLAIVKWIVYAHDGSISAESEPGSGSTFTVRLPMTESRPDSPLPSMEKPREKIPS